jgi:hypothetical protein
MAVYFFLLKPVFLDYQNLELLIKSFCNSDKISSSILAQSSSNPIFINLLSFMAPTLVGFSGYHSQFMYLFPLKHESSSSLYSRPTASFKSSLTNSCHTLMHLFILCGSFIANLPKLFTPQFLWDEEFEVFSPGEESKKKLKI